MSYQAVQRVMEHSKSTGTTRCVLIAIAEKADADGKGAYPSQETLAKLANTGVRNVRKCIAELEAMGEIITHKHGGPNGCNAYEIVAGYGPVTQQEPAFLQEQAFRSTTGTPVPVGQVTTGTGVPMQQEQAFRENRNGRSSKPPIEPPINHPSSPPTPPPSAEQAEEDEVDLWFLDEKGKPYEPDIRELIPRYPPSCLPELCRNRWGQRHRGALPMSGLRMYWKQQADAYGEKEGHARMVAAIVLASAAQSPYRYMATVLEAFPKAKPATIHRLKPGPNQRGSPPPPGYVEISALEADGFRRYGLTDTDVRSHVNEHGRTVWLIKRERRDELWEIEAATLKGSMRSSVAT